MLVLDFFLKSPLMGEGQIFSTTGIKDQMSLKYHL